MYIEACGNDTLSPWSARPSGSFGKRHGNGRSDCGGLAPGISDASAMVAPPGSLRMILLDTGVDSIYTLNRICRDTGLQTELDPGEYVRQVAEPSSCVGTEAQAQNALQQCMRRCYHCGSGLPSADDGLGAHEHE
jgi:hypothetical protein